MTRHAVPTALLVVLFTACEQSDKELCEDARKKLVDCGCGR